MTRSSDEVRSGVDLVTATGEALHRIGEDVLRINEHVKAIVTSAREQSVGLSEINSAVGQMDQVTQQNAAMVEQTNAASHTLASDAENLSRLVGQFKMNLGETAHARDPEQAAAVAPARPSPARALIQKVAGTFNRTASASASGAAAKEHWEESKMSNAIKQSGAYLEIVSFHLGDQEFCIDIMAIRGNPRLGTCNTDAAYAALCARPDQPARRRHPRHRYWPPWHEDDRAVRARRNHCDRHCRKAGGPCW